MPWEKDVHRSRPLEMERSTACERGTTVASPWNREIHSMGERGTSVTSSWMEGSAAQKIEVIHTTAYDWLVITGERQ